MKTLIVCSATIVSLFVFACHDDDDHDHATTGSASCSAIIEACHPKDTGSGPVHECHEAAEAATATEATCAAKKTECLATCNAADGDK